MNNFPTTNDAHDQPLASEETHDMMRQLLEDRKLGDYILPFGEPGLGKSYHAPVIDSQVIDLQSTTMDPIDLWGNSWLIKNMDGYKAEYKYRDIYDLPEAPLLFPDEPYVGERRVNKARKVKDRKRNQLARAARRRGR